MTHIAIYGPVTPGPNTGVGRQLYGLLAALQQIDAHNWYLIFSGAGQPLAITAPNFRQQALPFGALSRLPNHLFTALALSPLAASRAIDVVHIPNTMPLLLRRCPVVVTIFDLTEFALPRRVYGRARHRYRRLANRLAAKRADAIITTSSNTKDDIVRFLDVSADRVHVIYPGIDHHHFQPMTLNGDARAKLQQTYGLPNRFLLYVGKIQPRKNLSRLLHAFRQVRRAHPDVHLVLAGSRGWMVEDVDATVAQFDLQDTVHFTGFVSDADLPRLYNLAEIFVFPSLYEGFGFPIVEAMACGIPVVTSTTSSLGETAGDAASCVDPTAVDDMVAAIDGLLRDDAMRQALAKKGLARAQHFTWERCASETLACYEAVAGARDSGDLTLPPPG